MAAITDLLNSEYTSKLQEEAQLFIQLLSEKTRRHASTIEEKAANAFLFSLKKQADSLAIPSKVRGISKHQDVTHAIINQRENGRLRAVSMGKVERISAERYAVHAKLASGVFKHVGYVHKKHTPWLSELAERSDEIRCYIMGVNGQDRDGYNGLSIAFVGVGKALRDWQVQTEIALAKEEAREAEKKAETQPEKKASEQAQKTAQPAEETAEESAEEDASESASDTAPTRRVSIAAVTFCSTLHDLPKVGAGEGKELAEKIRQMKADNQPDAQGENEPRTTTEPSAEKEDATGAEDGDEDRDNTPRETTRKTARKTTRKTRRVKGASGPDPEEIARRQEEVEQMLDGIESKGDEMDDLFNVNNDHPII